MICKSQNCFYLASFQIMTHKIHVFWMLLSNTYWLPKNLTSLLLTLESFERLTFVNTFQQQYTQDLIIIGCLHFFLLLSLIFWSLLVNFVLFFIKWLYNELLNFSFAKYISSHPTSICSKLGFVLGALLLTLSISLNKFLLVKMAGTKHLTYLVIVDFTFKTCICTLYTNITYFWSYSQVLALQAVNGLALKNSN